MNHFSNKLIVKDPFEMPAVDDTTVLVLRECVDLVPHCWIWNESVGYLEVVTYSGYDIYVTVKNVGMKENATSGTIFPSCMEFLITAPNATPIIDNTVTCLRADFKCPAVGQEALMSVDSTSAIRVGDIIIVDTRYQYLVTEIINEHTMKVLNEEKGKEGGVIDVKCNECVPVKILESTHCCEALQDQVDDIYNRIDTKKSVVSNNVLLSVDHGIDAISDASYDIELDIDTDLSKYDNTTSQFITLSDIPSLPDDIDLSHYDNTTSQFITLSDIPALPADTDLANYDNTNSGFITSASLPTVNDATLTIYESDGVTPFVTFTANAATAVTATLPTSGNTYTATSPISIDANNDISISQASSTTDGYLSSTDWNTFNNKFGGLTYFEEYYSGGVANFQPKSGSATAFDLGYPGNGYTTAYIDTVRKENSYFSLPSDGGNITINCGAGGTYHTNYGDINFNIGNGNKLNLQPTQAVFDVNVVRKSSSNVSLGTNTNAWYEGWIQYIKTNQLKTVSGTAISVQANLEPGTSNTYTIGDSNYYNKIHTNNLHVGNIRIGGSNVTSINVETNTNINYSATSGTLKLLPPTTSSSTASTLGDSTHHWKNIYATNTYSNTVDPNSNNSGHVGSNNNYYAQMHCGTLTQHSDRKDKENIIERNIIERNITKGKITTSLDKVNSIRTYTFNFKEGDNIRTHLGMMADEVYKVEPLCASLLEDDTPGSKFIEGTPTGIDIGAMITLLLEGIKELSSEVKELKSKLGEQDADSKVLEK